MKNSILVPLVFTIFINVSAQHMLERRQAPPSLTSTTTTNTITTTATPNPGASSPTGAPSISTPNPMGMPSINTPNPSAMPSINTPNPTGMPSINTPNPTGMPSINTPNPSGMPSINTPNPSGMPSISTPTPNPSANFALPSSSATVTTPPTSTYVCGMPCDPNCYEMDASMEDCQSLASQLKANTQNFVVPSASPTWTQSYGSCEVVVVNQAQKAGFPDMDIVMCPFYVAAAIHTVIDNCPTLGGNCVDRREGQFFVQMQAVGSN